MTYIEILSKLVSFDTTTANDTLEAVNWVRHYLDTYGVPARLVYNETKTRASLVADFVGTPDKESVIFCGHMDVVPATTDAWDTNPFVMAEKDGRLFGRGTADMKGGIAVLLSLIPDLVARKKNFIIILTHNEEVAGNGIEEVLNDPQTQPLLQKATGCMVLEPTLSQIILGHKTATSRTIEIKGKPAHSSNPGLAVNALFHAVEIYKLFYDLAATHNTVRDTDFEIPYSVADILLMKGGTAVNIIPDSANLTYTCRFISEASETHFLTELENRVNAYTAGVSGLSVHFGNAIHLPALETVESADFVQKALSCFTFGAYKKVSFATEAGHFSLRGIPAIVCGPGNIEQAHQNNEFIEISQLDSFYEKLNHFCA